jgi:hypothetical protein
MKRRLLPLEIDLINLQKKEGDEKMVRARSDYFMQTLHTRGFQLVISVLRDMEQTALNSLRNGAGNQDRMLGWLQCIESIRKTLTLLLPEGDRPNVEWFDEESEGLLTEENESGVWE